MLIENNNKNMCMTSDLPDNSLDSVNVLIVFVFLFLTHLPSEGGWGVMAIVFIKMTKGLALP